MEFQISAQAPRGHRVPDNVVKDMEERPADLKAEGEQVRRRVIEAGLGAAKPEEVVDRGNEFIVSRRQLLARLGHLAAYHAMERILRPVVEQVDDQVLVKGEFLRARLGVFSKPLSCAGGGTLDLFLERVDVGPILGAVLAHTPHDAGIDEFAAQSGPFMLDPCG